MATVAGSRCNVPVLSNGIPARPARRISRSYTGFRAFLAIFFDLIFGLCFELVSAAVALAARIIVIAFYFVVSVVKSLGKLLVMFMTALVYALTLPFALLHHAVNRLRSPSRAATGSRRRFDPQARMGPQSRSLSPRVQGLAPSNPWFPAAGGSPRALPSERPPRDRPPDRVERRTCLVIEHEVGGGQRGVKLLGTTGAHDRRGDSRLL